jgi:hypothetical protein
MEAKREEKIARETQLNNTFKDIALEWHSSKLKKWSAGYASDILEAFNKDVFLHWQKTNSRYQTA